MKHSLLVFFLMLLACPGTFAQFQRADTAMWMTDEAVSAVARYGNTLYLGGDFTYVGPNTGRGATFRTSDGKLTDTPLLGIKGRYVMTSASDGKGGWFIGGQFTQVQGWRRNYLAHILADGTLDRNWNPNPDSWVDALAVVGNVVYVGGNFSTISGQSRPRLAALDATTGEATAWNPFADGAVDEKTRISVLAASGNVVYVGGNFTRIGGATRPDLAALDAVTGQATAWDAAVEDIHPNPKVDGYVNTVVVSGGIVYVGGEFDRIGGAARFDVGALDAVTGQATAWNPTAGGAISYSSYVNAIAVTEKVVYVGGYFRNFGGQDRNYLAAVDAVTGQVTPWDPNPSQAITSLAVAGNVVYAGGHFTGIGDQARNYLAALDATTGEVTGWNPGADRAVRTLTLADGVLFAGGDFSMTDRQRRNGLAALDVTTGRLTAWNPNPDGKVLAIAVSEGVVYAGGYFKVIGGQSRPYLAALDVTTGQATSWSPIPDQPVRTLKFAGNVLYVSGWFTQIGGQNKPWAAAFHATTGQVTPWSPGTDGPIMAFAPSGNVVYAGGYFSTAGGQPRANLAALDATTGQATAWNPGASGGVHALAVGENVVYAGGNFNSTVGGKERRYLAALDATTGQATAWNPGANWKVNAMAVSEGVVYVGGDFNTIAGQDRRYLAALDATTGQATAWRPAIGWSYVDTGVLSLAVWGNAVYAGGNFASPERVLNSYFSAFGRPGPVLSYVQGTVFEDTNGDCRQNPGEPGLPNQVVVARPGNYFTSTDSAGRYTLAVDTGTYTLQQVIPTDKQRFIRQMCPAEPPVFRFTGAGQTLAGQNFGNQFNLLPHLEADVSSTRRRRCVASTTIVYYANAGTAPAAGARVYVQLPPYVVLKSASAPFTRNKDGHYVFDLGTLAPDARGSIVLQDSVVCGNPNIRGLTQCTRAWITPANPTTPGDGWDHSDAVLKAACGNNGRVRLALYNHGTGSMADSSAFRIYLDAQLAFAGRYKLAPGDSLILQVPANGRTVRLEADQRPGHPTRRQSHITLEACGTNGSGTVSKGFVAQLPCDDPEPETAVECLPIIDSFDPNDKAVSPQGVGPERYTPTGAALDYVIRFQNTGTDVAYRVVVVDTLSEHLDLSTLRVGTVSHPYKMTVTGRGRPVLTFTFDNINLPDSTADEPRSHGRIGFSIHPKAGLPEKTRVENLADIFFDYNEPVRTNTTLNAIYDVPSVVEEAVRLDPAAICASTNGSVGAGSNQTVCGQVTGAVLAAAAPAQGKGKWKRVSGAGVVQDAENPASAVTGLGYGANVFEWSIPANACGSDSLKAQVTVTRLPEPATPGISRQGTDSLVCSLPGTDYA
ncbi:MAG: hypothetical protein ICV83_02260, partial [Cytophagales bacterium]|nr:hypothetical protein [Cytophagales bacterium]